MVETTVRGRRAESARGGGEGRPLRPFPRGRDFDCDFVGAMSDSIGNEVGRELRDTRPIAINILFDGQRRDDAPFRRSHADLVYNLLDDGAKRFLRVARKADPIS